MIYIIVTIRSSFSNKSLSQAAAKMKAYTWIAMATLFLIGCSRSLGCQQTNCCTGTSESHCCNAHRRDCCTTTTECCTRRSDCCSDKQKCCSDKQNCCSEKQTCCSDDTKDCCSDTTDCCSDGENRCSQPPIRVVQTEQPPIRYEPAGGSSRRDSSVKVDVGSTNTITNNNIINMTISVDSNVVNNIKNEVGGGGGGGNGTSVRVVERPVPVPVKVPVYGNDIRPPFPTPMPPTIPPMPTMPTMPIPNRCCIIVVPCITPGCSPYQYSCHGCRGNWGYMPINPCQGGCQKRTTWDRSSCALGHCTSRQVDCSQCHESFYETYSGYSECGGCFYG